MTATGGNALPMRKAFLGEGSAVYKPGQDPVE
jgi:hypothetical protein